MGQKEGRRTVSCDIGHLWDFLMNPQTCPIGLSWDSDGLGGEGACHVRPSSSPLVHQEALDSVVALLWGLTGSNVCWVQSSLPDLEFCSGTGEPCITPGVILHIPITWPWPKVLSSFLTTVLSSSPS